MSVSTRKPNGNSDSEVAQLLGPQIRFLRAAGVTLEEIDQIVRAEFRKRLPREDIGRVERVKYNNQCARLIANWKVLPEYLDRTGYPRDLRLSGLFGFAQLAKLSAPGVSPGDLLRVLRRYGSVERLGSGKLRLKTRVFMCKTPAGQLVAFEPNIQFLTDAARVVEDQIEINSGRGRAAHRYWRAVDNHWVPARFTREFISFSKRRGMELMEEIEDWLDEHEASRDCDTGRDLKRLGVGVFAISDRSVYRRATAKGRRLKQKITRTRN